MALNRKHDRSYAKRDQAGDRGRDKLPSFHAPLSPSQPAASQLADERSGLSLMSNRTFLPLK
jgi:hypothetical protein